MTLPAPVRPVAKAVVAAAGRGLLLLTDASLHRFGYRRTHSLLCRTSPEPPVGRADRARARQVAVLVHEVSDRRGWTDACLRRVLVTWWLLRWLRVPAVIRLGVSTAAQGSRGHAWLEVGGRPVGEASDVGDRYPLIVEDDLVSEQRHGA